MCNRSSGKRETKCNKRNIQYPEGGKRRFEPCLSFPPGLAVSIRVLILSLPGDKRFMPCSSCFIKVNTDHPMHKRQCSKRHGILASDMIARSGRFERNARDGHGKRLKWFCFVPEAFLVSAFHRHQAMMELVNILMVVAPRACDHGCAGTRGRGEIGQAVRILDGLLSHR